MGLPRRPRQEAGWDGNRSIGRLDHGKGEPGSLSGLVPFRDHEGDGAGSCQDRRRVELFELFFNFVVNFDSNTVHLFCAGPHFYSWKPIGYI